MVKQRSSARNIATNYISNEDGVSTDINLGNSRALDIGSRLADDQASVESHAMLDAIKGIDVAGGEMLANGLLMLGQNVDGEVFGRRYDGMAARRTVDDDKQGCRRCADAAHRGGRHAVIPAILIGCDNGDAGSHTSHQ